MDAKEFVKLNGLFVFKHALAQFRFKPKMFLVVYQDEYDFAHEIKPNHGNCIFSYDDVKRYVDAHELVQSHNGLENAKSLLSHHKFIGSHLIDERLEQAIQLVESVDEND